jgi:ubiquinone/menaquinone biosynthesis C-methylase UbiE
MSRPNYEEYTRYRYREDDVADRYAARHRFSRSPSEWIIAQLEIAGVQRALTSLTRFPVNRIVDVPCGTGKLTALLRSRGVTYVGLDISRAMMKYLPPKSGIVAQADASQLPLAQDSVDIVVCLRLLHRVPEEVVEAIIGDCLRVARLGVVVSYSAVPTSRIVHRALRKFGMRPNQWSLNLSATSIAAIAHKNGASVVRDGSISMSLTSERIASFKKNSEMR